MSTRDRREFLKKTVVAVTAVGLPACGPAGQADDRSTSTEAVGATDRALDPVLLRSIADVVLPTELGTDAREAAVTAFEAWVAGFEPATERPHPYISPEISYGPPDPAPGWRAQLTALELESRQRYGAGFADIEVTSRERLIRGQIDDSGGLPDTARARHVAVGLMAHFFDSSTAVDLCYGARIGKETCRGLSGLEGSPLPERLSYRKATPPPVPGSRA